MCGLGGRDDLYIDLKDIYKQGSSLALSRLYIRLLMQNQVLDIVKTSRYLDVAYISGHAVSAAVCVVRGNPSFS